MYRLKIGQGYRGLGPQSSPALSFLPKKGINMAPTGPFDPNSFRLHWFPKEENLGAQSCKNLNVTIIRFKCPVSWKRATFHLIYYSDQHTESGTLSFGVSGEQEWGKKSVTGCSMIHDFSLIVPKEFSSRKLLNVYNIETSSMSRCCSP